MKSGKTSKSTVAHPLQKKTVLNKAFQLKDNKSIVQKKLFQQIQQSSIVQRQAQHIAQLFGNSSSDNKPQRQTTQFKSSVNINNDKHLEAEADMMGAKAMQRKSMPLKEVSQLRSKEGQEPQKASFIQRKNNNTGLPDNLKLGVENLSGYSMDDVKVYYNSDKPAQLQAHAFAQGTNIHLASGQERHLPHEAWHVVQQKEGRVRPTMQMRGKVQVNDDRKLEQEADEMGTKAISMKSTNEGRILSKETRFSQSISTPIIQRIANLDNNTFNRCETALDTAAKENPEVISRISNELGYNFQIGGNINSLIQKIEELLIEENAELNPSGSPGESLYLKGLRALESIFKENQDSSRKRYGGFNKGSFDNRDHKISLDQTNGTPADKFSCAEDSKAEDLYYNTKNSGRKVRKVQIDHITPVSQHWNEIGKYIWALIGSKSKEIFNKFYNDTSNHQNLCMTHNSQKGGETYASPPSKEEAEKYIEEIIQGKKTTQWLEAAKAAWRIYKKPSPY